LEITHFEQWLLPDGPVALAISERLEPATAEEDPSKRVVFPPTYADPGGDKKKPYYAIDETPNGLICLMDSVGSQANRIEPIFKGESRPELAELVPKVTVRAGERVIDLLDLGHRAADAVIRFSDHGEAIRRAFLDYRDNGDARALAKIAPTSLVFGAWDSRGDSQDARGTGAKIPRIVESTIRAYGVHRLHRAATYLAAFSADDKEKLGLQGTSEEGLANALAHGPGGVIVKDGIRREALLNLTPLRAIKAGRDNHEETLKLQKYILGLALVAFLSNGESYLRQGCLLVSSESEPARKETIWRTGKRKPLETTENEAVAFAQAAARAFGVGPRVEAIFDPKRMKTKKQSKAATVGEES
jgi:CRISPR-associated protein Csb1